MGSVEVRATAEAAWRTRAVIAFAEGYAQYWSQATLSPTDPTNLTTCQAVFNPPNSSTDGQPFTFDSPDNQWRTLRVHNATHNFAYTE